MGQDTAWIDIPVSKNYTVSFQLLGSRIVLVLPQGTPRAEDFIMQESIRQDYLKEIGLLNKNFVELHDLKGWGKINRRCRQSLLDFFERESKQEHFRGFIAFNFDFTVSDVVNLFLLRKYSRLNVKIVTSFKDAEKAAFLMMEKEGLLHLSKKSMVPGREYWHSEESFSEGFTLLNNMILYSEVSGEMSKQAVKNRFNILRSMLYNASLPLNTHFEILVWGKKSSIQMKTLRYFLTEQFKSNKEYQCSMLCIVCGNAWVEKVFNTSRKLFPIPIFVTQSYREALRQIAVKSKDLPRLNQGVFYHEKFDSRGSITQEHFDQYVSELERYIQNIDKLQGMELKEFNSEMAYDHPMLKAMNGIKSMKLKIDQERMNLIKEKNTILYQRNRGEIRLLIKDIQSGEFSDKLPQRVQTCLLNSLFLSHCAMFELSGEGEQLIMRCISDNHDSSRRSLAGTLIPSPLARYVTKKEFSSFSPSELASLSHSDEILIPYIKSFIQTRNFQYIFFMKSCHNKSVYLYLEIPNTKDYPFSLKDVYDAVFEVYSSIHHKEDKKTGWDYDLTLSEFDGDSEFLLDVLTGFFERSKPHLKAIQDSIDANDDKLLKAECHKFKGAAANLFAEDLRLSAMNLEKSAIDRDRSSYLPLFRELKNELDNFKKAVNQQFQLQI